MKLKKRTDAENILGWDEIEIISERISIIKKIDLLTHGDNFYPGSVYEYEYFCVVTHDDGIKTLELISGGDLESSLPSYDVIKNKRFSIAHVSPIPK